MPKIPLFFYFSGHGISKGEDSFLLTANSDSTNLDTLELTATPLGKVQEILARIKANQMLNIIDVCRNDPSSGGDDDNLLTDTFARDLKLKHQNKSPNKPAVSAMLYACSVGERAYEWSQVNHGIFSYYLLEGINGKAANSKGNITITDLADYTQTKVGEWANNNKGRQQTPWLSLQGGSRLVLAENVVSLSKITDQGSDSDSPTLSPPSVIVNSQAADPETEMWGLIKDTTEASDIRDFLDLFPSGKLTAVAKFKLKQLERKAKSTKSIAETKVESTKSTKSIAKTKVESTKLAEVIVSPKGETKMALIPVGGFSFYMDIYEVTNAQYSKFVQATGHRPPKFFQDADLNQPNQPVVGVSWQEAITYAQWAGKRLPTEKEWESAARGGLIGKKYPNTSDVDRDQANYEGSSTGGWLDSWSFSAPVGSFPANNYGLYDMAGNVNEWCWAGDSRGDQSNSPAIRGGSWNDAPERLSVSDSRKMDAEVLSYDIGFRCVIDLASATRNGFRNSN